AASLSYSKRLQVALPYYNNVTANELSGIQWLKGKKGRALVTAKGVGLNAGTQYSWLIEGLSRVRAYGTGEGYLSVLPVAVGETNDAERILSGNDIIETEVLRAAQRSDNRSQIDLFGLMDATWQPLISISPIWLDGSDPLSQVQRSQRRGESALLTWSSKSSLTGQMLAGSLQLASGHTS